MKRLFAALLLVGGFLVAAGVAQAVTLIDSSALSYGSGGYQTDNLNRLSIVFTVGGAGYSVSSVQFIPIWIGSGSGALNQNVTITMYQWDTSINAPVGSAIATETFTSIPYLDISTVTTSDIQTLTFSSPVTLNPSTSYGIVFGPSTRNSVFITGAGFVTTGVPTGNGVAYVGVSGSGDSGSTWASYSTAVYVNVSGTNLPTPSAVPTLSEWTQLLLALMTITLVGWHFHRERSY